MPKFMAPSASGATSTPVLPNCRALTRARSAGYAKCYDFSELPSFEQQIGHVLHEDGPVFGTLHVERTRPLAYDYPALYAADAKVKQIHPSPS